MQKSVVFDSLTLSVYEATTDSTNTQTGAKDNKRGIVPPDLVLVRYVEKGCTSAEIAGPALSISSSFTRP